LYDLEISVDLLCNLPAAKICVMSSTSKVFDEAAAEKRFLNAKNTQESIQGVSSWAMQHKSHHEKIVAVWLSVLKKCEYDRTG